MYDKETPLREIKCPPKTSEIEYISEHWSDWFEDKTIYPGVFLTREFDKARVLKDGPRFASRAAEALADMKPYRDLIHNWTDRMHDRRPRPSLD